MAIRKRFMAFLATPVVTLVLMLLFPGIAVSIAAMVFATVSWLVFVVWYAVRSKWWQTPYSRNLMGTGFAIFLLLVVFSTALIFGAYPGHLLVWTLVFLNLGVLAVQRTYYMEKVQRAVEMGKKN